MLQKSSGQCCLIGKLSHTSDSGCVICLTFDRRQGREREITFKSPHILPVAGVLTADPSVGV